MKKVILDIGIEVEIPEILKYSKCKGCEANDLIWAKTKSGKDMPIHRVGNEWTSHFSDCPNADKFRKKRRGNGK